jgi:hypothetical protein
MPRAKKKPEEIKKETTVIAENKDVTGKKVSEDSDIIMDAANVNDSFAKQMLKLLHSKAASVFVMNTLKVIIPKISNGIIIPKECYYDEKKNTLNIFFDINTAKPYSVSIVVTNTDTQTKYDISVKADDVNYNVIFTECYTMRSCEPMDF